MNVALIGAGGMGKRWAGILANLPDVVLRAIVDLDLDRAKIVAGLFEGVEVQDLETVLQDDSIEAAVVVLPHSRLAKVSRSFIQAGKHVICEKPGGISAAEVSEVQEAARKHAKTFMVGFNHRFHPSHLEAKKILSEGGIGMPLFLRAVYGFGGRAGYTNEWRHTKNISGGGELIDQGVHLIDLARWFLGDIETAKGFAEDLFWKSGVDDNAFLLLRSMSGAVASLHASWSQWNPKYLLELYGTDGYIRIEGLGKKYGGTERVYVGKRNETYGVNAEQMIECDTNADASLAREFSEFKAAVKEGRDPVPSGKDGIAALQIVETIYGAR